MNRSLIGIFLGLPRAFAHYSASGWKRAGRWQGYAHRMFPITLLEKNTEHGIKYDGLPDSGTVWHQSNTRVTPATCEANDAGPRLSSGGRPRFPGRHRMTVPLWSEEASPEGDCFRDPFLSPC